MPLKSAPYYWVECDECSERIEYDEFAALANSGDAISLAIDYEWTRQGDRFHCPECPVIADCDNCGKDAGPLPLERDGLCRACWDEAEAKTTAPA